MFLLVVTVFLVRVPFLTIFYFFRFQNSEKSVPSRTSFDCFPRNGTFFYYFLLVFRFQNSEKCTFTRKMRFIFKLVLTVFLIMVPFFNYFLLFSDFKNSKNCKKNVPLRGKQSKLVKKNCIFLVRVHFFHYFQISN